MSAKDIQHFLLIFHVDRGIVDIEHYGFDYEGALEAYELREKEYRERGQLGDEVDIVLLGADSIETVKKTHSSYFDDAGGDHGFAEYLKLVS